MSTSTAIVRARRKLQGTWRSNRARTVSNWVFPKRLAAKKLRYFEGIFGRNTWHFTSAYCYGSYKKQTWKARYKIIWADEWSAVVVFTYTEGSKERCHHLFFDDEYFYLVAGRAGNAEYFKKVRA